MLLPNCPLPLRDAGFPAFLLSYSEDSIFGAVQIEAEQVASRCEVLSGKSDILLCIKQVANRGLMICLTCSVTPVLSIFSRFRTSDLNFVKQYERNHFNPGWELHFGSTIKGWGTRTSWMPEGTNKLMRVA